MTHVKQTITIVGNWKMYKTIEESLAFLAELTPLVKDSPNNIWLAVPYTSLKSISDKAKGGRIVIGAQNMNDAAEGAFTGEIAAKMIKEAGAQFVVVGHSERRTLFHETNALIDKKVQRALLEGLQPILCIGESAAEREEGKTHEVLSTQLTEGLTGIAPEQLGSLLIAYEPIWAIGSGITATPENAQEVHLFCRELIAKQWNEELANRIPILYGGSVKPDNAPALLDQPDIDGLLVGGASLSADTFSKIVNYQHP